MPKALLIILVHQTLFQGMFFAKNVYLRNKIGQQIGGRNTEAVRSIVFFTGFIVSSTVLSCFDSPAGTVRVIESGTSTILALVLIGINLITGAASLVNMKDSWRVGILEDQKTPLVKDGIYRYSRNPYFLSYLIMFAAYTILLQSLVLLGFSLVAFFLVHSMIIREEKYLESVHGEDYIQYKAKVPRYFIV